MGAAIARHLAAAGRPVSFTYNGLEDQAHALAREIEANGGSPLPLQADSANPDAIRRAIEAGVERFGGLGVLVVNAGIPLGGTIERFAMADFDRMVAVNVRGVFAASHYAARHMLDGGRIVTIGSNTADHIGIAGSSVYATTKAAVAQLVRGAALDFAPRRITVNNVQPGPVETDMTTDLMEQIVAKLPLDRIGRPDEVADVVAWLTGLGAGYMTAARLTTDGGRSA